MGMMCHVDVLGYDYFVADVEVDLKDGLSGSAFAGEEDIELHYANCIYECVKRDDQYFEIPDYVIHIEGDYFVDGVERSYYFVFGIGEDKEELPYAFYEGRKS